MLCMVAAQGNELLAYRTATVGLSLANLCVLDYSLHLLTARQSAVGVSALTSVHQRLNTSLNGELSRFLGISLLRITRR
jgi:hypothetical protein